MDFHLPCWYISVCWLGTFASHIERQHGSPPSVIVIGAGISGISAAHILHNASIKVVIFSTLKSILIPNNELTTYYLCIKVLAPICYLYAPSCYIYGQYSKVYLSMNSLLNLC